MEYIAISAQLFEPTRVKVDVACALLGISRAEFIRNVATLKSGRRLTLQGREIFGTFSRQYFEHLYQVENNKKEKKYRRFRQTIKIPREDHDVLNKLHKTIRRPLGDILEGWLIDAVDNLFECYPENFGALVEAVLAIKRGETIDDIRSQEIILELMKGEISETRANFKGIDRTWPNVRC